MKLNATYFTCFNKLTATVGLLVLCITVTHASWLPVKFSSINTGNTNLIQNAPGVIYASLDAIASEKSVIVKWVTASELNNSHFEVERSLDMKVFKTVALILDGFTAIGTGKSYQFKEDAVIVKNGKTVYYRLKQFNEDGISSYSPVLAVRLEEKPAASGIMLVSPNPVSENLSIRFNSTASGNAEIRIISLTGQTLLSKQSTIVKGVSHIPLEGFNKLSNGMYLAQLICKGSVVETQKLVKE